jgi:hypothetical protein
MMRAHVLVAMLAVSGIAITAERDPATSDGAWRVIGESTNAALQGDARGARAALLAVPSENFRGKDATYRACMIERFATDAASPVMNVSDPFARQALSIYRGYWHAALIAPERRDALAEALRHSLIKLLEASDPDWETLEAALVERLRRSGYYAQSGETPPLRELMMWRRQDSQLHRVSLPDGVHQVRVERLEDFATAGWSSYARCERGSTGGWVGEDRIFAVMPAFADESGDDAFHSSLLAHETQHFADQEQLPGLEPWELEYRAKLTELWAARGRLRKLLADFAASRSDDTRAPHTYANKRVIADLREQLRAAGRSSKRDDLGDVDEDAVRRVAERVLREDTHRRR